jgi:hypothetical protein
MSSLPASIVMPGLLFNSVRRYACRNDETPKAVAAPKTHGHGGVHTLRIRAVSGLRENPVKAPFPGPSLMRFITDLCLFSPGPQRGP